MECMPYDRRFSMLTVNSGENRLEYGRQELTFSNGKSIYVTAHRAMYMCIKQISSIPRNYEISHLCHNSRCIRPDHLTMEPHAINMERLRCTHTLPKKMPRTWTLSRLPAQGNHLYHFNMSVATECHFTPPTQ